ncbi:MAG: hypothetical protein E7624_07910 [Ruminococcaceae bacterium]|nr:hypothetical protein [Oscillospiraceae bacterium]
MLLPFWVKARAFLSVLAGDGRRFTEVFVEKRAVLHKKNRFFAEELQKIFITKYYRKNTENNTWKKQGN